MSLSWVMFHNSLAQPFVHCYPSRRVIHITFPRLNHLAAEY
jgi:hypothetical protein